MPLLLVVGMAAIVLWSLVSHRFERWGVAGPVGLMILGALTVVWGPSEFAAALDTHVAERVVEIVLAILLFVDATEVKGGLFGGEGRATARLVLIGLPLSVILAGVLAAFLVPVDNLGVIVIIVCILLPTDFSPAAQLLRSKIVPLRVRQILNVESGYNDGLISPLFSMALALAVLQIELGDHIDTDTLTDEEQQGLVRTLEDFGTAFLNAGPATLIAAVVGIVLGGAIGYLVRFARRRELAGVAGVRFVMLLLPLIAYGIATVPVINANGFIAAFVAGLVYRVTRTADSPTRTIDHAELTLADEIGTLTSNFVWFIVGGVAVLVIIDGIDWMLLILAVLGLTVLRMLPVYVSLLGSSVPRRDRWTIGALGPRGTASIVFGLLAYNALDDENGYIVLTVMVLTVVSSIVLHGFLAPLAVRRIYRDQTGLSAS